MPATRSETRAKLGSAGCAGSNARAATRVANPKGAGSSPWAGALRAASRSLCSDFPWLFMSVRFL